MFRIAALNESLSSDGSKSRLPISSATKEAKESEAFILYNKALSYLRHGEVTKAEEVFRELIQHPFLHEAKESLESSQDHVHPGLQLLYSIHKNMAALATQRGDHIAAVESYLEAIKIDTSEVTVWFKIGTLAVKTENYQLAKFGFQQERNIVVPSLEGWIQEIAKVISRHEWDQGLECNPKHWPCLDHLITILFALCNYWACLYYISKGLEMDGNYSKGLALRNQIFKEIPSFRRESQHLWTFCDSEVMERQVDPEEAKEFIDEAEAIRTRRRELAKAPDPPRLKLKPLKSLTWKCVGESLVEMYDLATSSNPPMSLGLRVDMSEFKAIDEDISPYNANEAKEKVSNGNSDPKNEVNPHKLDAHSTKLNEGGLHISEIKHPHMEIEHPITEPPEHGDKTYSVQLGGGDASSVGNKKSNAMMEPMDCTTQMRVPEIHEEKFESSFAVSKEREHSAYSSNNSNAVQTERINTTNAVSDLTVLSASDGCQRRPGNLPSKTDVHTLLTGAVSNISQDGSSTVTHNKLIASMLKESSSDFLNQQQAQFPLTSHTLAPGIIHSSLTGLQMSSTNVPLLMKSSLTQSDLNIISSFAQYSLASGLSFSQSAQSGIGLPSHSHSNLDLSSVSQSNLAGQSGLSLVSGAQTGLNLAQSDPSLMSVTQSGLNLLPVAQPGISSSRLIQPGLSQMMMSQSGLQQADSLPHRVMFIPMSSSGAPSVGTSLNSVSSSISAILSAVTKALTPLNIPVPLPSYSQAGLIQSKVQAPAAEEQQSVQTSLAQELEEKSPIGSKKGQKRKREVQILEDLGSKRRSARVRSTTKKKEEESINFYELLQAFLPSSLKQVQDADSMEMDPMDEEQPQAAETSTPGVKRQGEVAEGTVAAQSLNEEEKEVKEFLKNSVENSGLISLMLIFVSHLAKRSHRKWPAGLADIYIKVYMHVRKHISLPQFMSEEDTEGTYQDMGKICLVWAELQLDQWIIQSKSLTSPITSPRNQSPTSHILPNKKLPEFCQDDMGFIMELCAWSNLLQEEWLQHCVRAYWMKARFNMLQGKIEEALFCFNKILEYFNFSKEEGEELKHLVLPNCSLDNTISRDQVRTLQESLQRCQSLEETQKFYESGNYHRVVDLLLQTFKSTARQKGKLIGIATALPERHSQLMLLQDSLFKIGNYENCLLWGEESFMEAYQQYRMAKSEQSKKEWTDTMIHIIKALQKLFDKNVTCIRSLPSAKLVRFAQNLVKVVEITMSVPESVTEMPLGTVLPWILLYKLIKHEEDKLKAMQIKESASENAFDEGIPSSLMLLNIAHEYLGSRSWCTKSDGAFLLCFMDVLKEKMASNQYDKEINQAFEQCVYCLYGHPNKRGRVRQLTDHMVQQIHLTWDRAIDLFEYFKPKTLPEFDSFKSDTISGEVEHLLKKISQLIPEDEKAVGVSLEDLHNYIEGQTNFPPTMSSERQVKRPIVKELYYLLADYYLKVNKEAGKAIKFYLHDLCVNPTRLDSWAGMALARMSQLEQKLSSIDLRMDVPIYKKSIAALRCFKRAVEVDATNRKLWIEYGSLAYQLHAHSSRQLRWEKWFPVGDELHQIAQDSRQEMLQISYNCYNKASEGEADGTEEKWLTNYMRGKCLEKMRKTPKEYLYHFVKAAKYIHEENAFYPKRITFAYTTPKLAVEALEMYYRLHVAILKYILKSSDTQDYPLYWKYVEEAANSPFARGMEKRHEKKDGRDSALHEENSMPIVTTPNRKSKTYQVPSSDHTYVRQKSNSSSVDKYMSEDSFVATETVPATMATSSAETPKDVQLGVPMQYPESQKGIEVCTAKSVSQAESLKDRIDWVSPSRTEEKGKVIACDNFSKAFALEVPQDPVLDIPVVQRFDSQQTTVSKLDENILQLGMHKTDAMESTNMQRDSDKRISVDINVSKDGQSGSVSLPKSDDEIDLSIHVAKGSHPKPDMVGPTWEAEVADKSNQEANKSTHDSKENRSGPVRYPSSQAFSVSSIHDLSEDSEEGLPSIEVSSETEAKKEKPVTSREDDGKSSDRMEQPMAEDESNWTLKMEIDQPELKTGLTATLEEQKYHADSIGLVTDVKKNNAGEEKDTNETLEEVKKEENEFVSKDTNQARDARMEVAMDLARDDKYDQDKVLMKEKTRDTAQMKSETKSLEKTESKEDEISTTEPGADRKIESEEELKRNIIDKCRAALELCLQRFPTHYKSLYRLAHMYMYSTQHKNLEYARDLLLGNTQWQNLSHMPTQGLFTDRKQNNFFQGIWKIPIEEIDRSGSFPTHLNRSVALLLELMKEQGDFLMLNKVHMQLLRSPDSGKKYLRDAERVYLAKLAYTTALDVIDTEAQKLKTVSDEEKKIKFIMDAYKVWEYAAPKTAILGDRINDVLAQAYKAIKKTNLQATNVLIEQAIRFCRQQQYEQAMKKTNQSFSDGAISEDVKSPTPVSVEKNDMPLATSPAETCTAKMVSDPQIANKFSSDPITATDLPTQTVSIETGAPSTTNMNTIQSESKTGNMDEPHDDGNFVKEPEHMQIPALASQASGAESNKDINSENNTIKTEPVISTQTSGAESEKSVIYLSDSFEPTTSPTKNPSAEKQHQESIEMLQSSVMDDSSKEVSQSSVAGDLNSTAGDVSRSSMSDDLSQSDDEEDVSQSDEEEDVSQSNVEEDVSQSNVGESKNQSSEADDTSQSSMDDDDSSQSSTAGNEPSESNEEQDDLSFESSSGTTDNSSDEDYAVSDDVETESSSDLSFSDLENSQLVRSTPQTGPRAAVSSAFPVHLVKNTMAATLPQPQLQPKSFQDQFLKAISQSSYQSQFIRSVQADTSRFQMGAGTSIAGADLSSKTKVTRELINSPDSQGESKNVASLPVVEQGMSAESGNDDDDDVIMICSSPEAGAQDRQSISVTGTAISKVLELSKDKYK